MTRILITSALPYINGIKHLGNLAGSMLPADVYARFQRAQGHEVLCICATDEHGTPAELAAAAAGQDVRTYCDEQHAAQKRVGEAYGLSWDWFGRSSNSPNRRLTQHFAEALEARGLIEERTDQMIYSVADARFLPDRYVEGTCPHCGFRPARGDQCDNCGQLLDPVDLVEPYSTVSGSSDLEMRKTRNLYFLQAKLEPLIRAWLESKAEFPSLSRAIAMKHLNEGVIDRGITRDLKWGVPVTKGGVARPGFQDKVFYVWFDAPIEYIGATVEWSEATGADWTRWWRTDQGAHDVRYIQFMGKDNVAFHTVSFPGTLLGSGEPWKSVDVLKSFNWLTWYGGKFSTSKKRGVFMDAALELLPAGYWRWYLTANAPESSDAPFTWEHFAATVNSDLANVLGNFLNRILRFAESRFGGVVPEGGQDEPLEAALRADLRRGMGTLTAELEGMNMRAAAKALRELWVIGNSYLTEAAPWTAIKTDPERAATVVRIGLGLAELFGRLSAPFVPFTAAKIAAVFGQAAPGPWPAVDEAAALEGVRPGVRVSVPELLFAKVEDAQVTEWSAHFGGVEAPASA